MSFWSAFTGQDASQNAQAAEKFQTQQISNASNTAQNAYNTANTGYNNYLSPYAATGTAANKQYSDAIGLNGAPAQSQYMQQYANNPYLQMQNQLSLQAVNRSNNALGLNNSGAAALAGTRVTDQNLYNMEQSDLNRLSGLQGQGLQVAGQQANQAINYGNQTAGNAINTANGMNNAYGNMMNAETAGNQAFANNVIGGIGAVGSLFGAGMRPGANGAASPFGNMMSAAGNAYNGVSGGVSNMLSGWGSNSYAPQYASQGGNGFAIGPH
ncbi:MAG: hypothetical protein KGP14_03785 [Betaproteobacteria bacterium]|nr:hypothetical protein [Betaproteobacteria bacterium]